MGSEDGSEAEKPVHRVSMNAFYIDVAAVTNADFLAFVRDTGYKTSLELIQRRADTDGDSDGRAFTWRTWANPDRMNHPVVYVSWFDANAFANWAGKRLPTEAEWEYSARGGMNQVAYPWGYEKPNDKLVNWNKSWNNQSEPPTTPAGAFPANPYGLYDMAGNIWQWCYDWYNDATYRTCEESNPAGPKSGDLKVRRGAAWNVREPFRLRCANRGAMLPEHGWPNLGFRCARSM